jgi:hypothetical protein
MTLLNTKTRPDSKRDAIAYALLVAMLFIGVSPLAMRTSDKVAVCMSSSVTGQ